MQRFRLLLFGFVVVVVLAACTTGPTKERGRVYCPACGTDFDALYEKRF